MTESTVTELKQPGEFEDHLTDAIRAGAQKLLAEAIDGEVSALLEEWAHEKLADGKQRLVRHGYQKERQVLSGVGPVSIRKHASVTGLLDKRKE